MSVVPGESLPAVSYAVDPGPHRPLLDRVAALVDAVATGARQSGGTLDVPPDHAARVRDGLAAQAPVPVLGRLTGVGYVADVEVPTLLAGTPPALGLQVLAAYGLLTPAPRTDHRHGGPTARLRRLLAPGPPAPLLEVEALLAGLAAPGLDPTTVLALTCVVADWDGAVVATGWPADAVAPWVRRSTPTLLALHEQESGTHGWSRPHFFALLATLDPLPDEVAAWLLARALGAKAADRPGAQALVADHPERSARCRAALGHRTAGVRTAAASWLAAAPLPGDDEVVAALAASAAREQDDAALGALLDALVAHGEQAVDHLDRDALDAAAARAAARPVPAALDWLDLAAIPRPRWSDTGAEVPVATVRAWVQRAVKGRSAEPGALLRTLLDAVDPEGRRALSDALLHGWLAAGAPSTARGVLALVSLGAGERTAVLAADFVRTRAKQAGTQAQAMVGLLARTDLPVAVQALVEAAGTSPSAAVRKAAAAEVEALAERRGWTVDQVGDRGAPTGGFDATGRMVLDYGPRRFTAVLQPDLKVVVEPDDGGRPRTSLPPARATDDAGRVAEAKATLAAARKTVTATAKAQVVRLREAMTVQRSWTVVSWRDDVAGHPVLGRLATGLVWSCGGVTFRPLDDGSLTDVDDEPVDLDDLEAAHADARVTLVHDALLDPDLAAAWREHLADYEVALPFAQLSDPLPPVDPASTGLVDVVGVTTSAGALHRLAERAGFRRIVGDGGAVAAYARDLPGGVGAVLEVRGGAWVGDWAAPVELGPLLLADPRGPVALGSLPPVLLAELRRDLRALGG